MGWGTVNVDTTFKKFGSETSEGTQMVWAPGTGFLVDWTGQP